MPVKIRLTRHGRKRYAYYHIVVADSRAPRDGRYIDRIGSYNPNTNPATIDLDFDKALSWLQKGAQPTDTARAILSYKGVLYKNHLLGGVRKGAFDEEESEKRFETWLAEKEAKIQAKKERLEDEIQSALKKRLDAESKVNEGRAAALAAKNAELAAEAEASRKTEKTETEDETTQADVITEESMAEVETAEADEVTDETVAEVETADADEVTDETVAEVETAEADEVTDQSVSEAESAEAREVSDEKGTEVETAEAEEEVEKTEVKDIAVAQEEGEKADDEDQKAEDETGDEKQ